MTYRLRQEPTEDQRAREVLINRWYDPEVLAAARKRGDEIIVHEGTGSYTASLASKEGERELEKSLKAFRESERGRTKIAFLRALADYEHALANIDKLPATRLVREGASSYAEYVGATKERGKSARKLAIVFVAAAAGAALGWTAYGALPDGPVPMKTPAPR